MGYPNGGTKGPKPGKLICVMHILCICLICLIFPYHLNLMHIGFASKDMVLKLDPQMDKHPSLMVNNMCLILLL